MEEGRSNESTDTAFVAKIEVENRRLDSLYRQVMSNDPTIQPFKDWLNSWQVGIDYELWVPEFPLSNRFVITDNREIAAVFTALAQGGTEDMLRAIEMFNAKSN